MTRKIEHPCRGLTGGTWLRGNLHMHTTRSDGSRKPQRAINDYASRGYDFIAITDHDQTAMAAEYRKLDCKGMVMRRTTLDFKSGFQLRPNSISLRQHS